MIKLCKRLLICCLYLRWFWQTEFRHRIIKYFSYKSCFSINVPSSTNEWTMRGGKLLLFKRHFSVICDVEWLWTWRIYNIKTRKNEKLTLFHLAIYSFNGTAFAKKSPSKHKPAVLHDRRFSWSSGLPASKGIVYLPSVDLQPAVGRLGSPMQCR